MSGKNIGNIIYIPRMRMSPSQSPWPFKLMRRQFPIVVCYVMTINKSQGQSLQNVGLYLPRPVFSHGQLYVALSRVQSKEGLKVLIHDGQNQPLTSTTNVVFKEIQIESITIFFFDKEIESITIVPTRYSLTKISVWRLQGST